VRRDLHNTCGAWGYVSIRLSGAAVENTTGYFCTGIARTRPALLFASPCCVPAWDFSSFLAFSAAFGMFDVLLSSFPLSPLAGVVPVKTRIPGCCSRKHHRTTSPKDSEGERASEGERKTHDRPEREGGNRHEAKAPGKERRTARTNYNGKHHRLRKQILRTCRERETERVYQERQGSAKMPNLWSL
jgi:hypothetical protein